MSLSYPLSGRLKILDLSSNLGIKWDPVQWPSLLDMMDMLRHLDVRGTGEDRNRGRVLPGT